LLGDKSQALAAAGEFKRVGARRPDLSENEFVAWRRRFREFEPAKEGQEDVSLLSSSQRRFAPPPKRKQPQN